MACAAIRRNLAASRRRSRRPPWERAAQNDVESAGSAGATVTEVLSVVTVAPVAAVPVATATASVTDAVPLLVIWTCLVTGKVLPDFRMPKLSVVVAGAFAGAGVSKT